MTNSRGRSWATLLACLVILTTPLAAARQNAAAAQAPPAPVRVGGDIQAPRKIKDVKPVYPAEAQQARVQGIVIIEATIDPTGKIGDAVVKRSIPLLDAAALQAVRQWEFTPTIVNGVAVPVIMTVTVNFAMQGGGPVAPLGSMIRLISRPQDGGMLVWDITRERASQLPRWDPAAAPVPLSTADAASRAQAWLREHHPDAPPLELTTAMLSRVRRGGDIDFWIYQLDFFSYNAPYPLRWPYSVVVLPDGTIADPRIEPPPSADAWASATAAEIELPPGVVRIGPGVIGPRLIHEERPRYTTAAMGQRIQGSVLLEGIVETDGSVSNVRVVRSLDANYGLDNEALIAARKWRFSPGIKDGHPVRVLVTMEMTFTLRK